MTKGTDQQSKRIVVAGSGRSGTTWISSVLAECQSAISVFEPLNLQRVPNVPLPAGFPTSPGKYLHPANSPTDWQDFFQQLFTGRITSAWTRQDWRRATPAMGFMPLGEKLAYYLARKRYEKDAGQAEIQIVKTIRGNLLLDWLVQHFPVRVVFVLRHPCAVVASRLRHRWSSSLEGIIRQSALVQDHLQSLHGVLNRAETDLERMAILWCVENLVPLAARRADRVSIHWYEDFDRNPEQEFHNLIGSLRLRLTESTGHAIHRYYSNSSTAVKKRRRVWHAGLGASQGRCVLEICKEFGLQLYGTRWDPLDEDQRILLRQTRPLQPFETSRWGRHAGSLAAQSSGQHVGRIVR